jgi:hypothetical protein
MVKRNRRSSLSFPNLHEEVCSTVSSEVGTPWFNSRPNQESSTQEYSTFIMAKFTCPNRNCDSIGWGSKKVAIVIKRYRLNGYHADVFNQRCKKCEQLGTMEIDEESYVQRVAYRLEKWAGVHQTVARGQWKEHRGPPHRHDLCEGCKQGVCKQDRDD